MCCFMECFLVCGHGSALPHLGYVQCTALTGAATWLVSEQGLIIHASLGVCAVRPVIFAWTNSPVDYCLECFPSRCAAYAMQ